MGSHFSSPGALPSFSKDIFQGFGGLRSRPSSPPPARRVAPSVFRRAERENVTKYIIKSPKFIPSSTQDRLRAEAKIIVKNKNEFTKQEYEYAQNLLHPDRVLKTAKQKLENTIGNIQTLTEIKDRGIHDVWAATHKTKEMAKGANVFEEKTLLEKNVDHTPEPPKETHRLTKPAIGGFEQPALSQSSGPSNMHQANTVQPSWKVPEKSAPTHTVSNQATHASEIHSTSKLGSFSAGALHYGIHSQHGTQSAEPDMFAPTAPAESVHAAPPTTPSETTTAPTPPTPDIPSADSVHDLAID